MRLSQNNRGNQISGFGTRPFAVGGKRIGLVIRSEPRAGVASVTSAGRSRAVLSWQRERCRRKAKKTATPRVGSCGWNAYSQSRPDLPLAKRTISRQEVSVKLASPHPKPLQRMSTRRRACDQAHVWDVILHLHHGAARHSAARRLDGLLHGHAKCEPIEGHLQGGLQDAITPGRAVTEDLCRAHGAR